jgi:hypothetical protein
MVQGHDRWLRALGRRRGTSWGSSRRAGDRSLLRHPRRAPPLGGPAALLPLGIPHDFDWSLQLVADFESAAVGDPNFDFRYLPAVGGTLDFFREVMTVYEAASGQRVDIRRVLGWHVRTFLGDAVGRSDAGVALPGGGTPAMWVAEVATRVQVLGAESP